MKIFVLIFFIFIAINNISCNSSTAGRDFSNPISRKTYILATVKKGGVSSEVNLPAQLAAYESVNIFPKVNGYVKSVLVDIGSKVLKGNLLMTLEAPELQQALVQAKEKFEKAKTDFSLEKEHYQRLLEAAETPGAISPLDISTIKSNMEADSVLCNAEKANWMMQQAMTNYLQVTAPFSGVITQRNVDPGALVNATEKDKPMLELKQTDHLRLQIDVPETISSLIKEKDTIEFTVDALKGEKMKATIVRNSENINNNYRSQRMEADIYNKNGLLAPGMYADVKLKLNGNALALTVPKTSLVTSTESKYVLKDSGNSIKKIPVITGNESNGMIEVFGNLQPDDNVIINATDEIKESNAQ